jgi:multiple sugar transport system ATP-binding protein
VANFVGSTPMKLPAGKVLSGSDGSASFSVADGSLPAAIGSVPTGAEVTVGVLARQPVTVA